MADEAEHRAAVAAVQARDGGRKGANAGPWLHSVDRTARRWRDRRVAADEQRGRDTRSEDAGLELGAGTA